MYRRHDRAHVYAVVNHRSILVEESLSPKPNYVLSEEYGDLIEKLRQRGAIRIEGEFGG